MEGMIKALIESAFSGINARIDILEKRQGATEESVKDLTELTGLMDKTIENMAKSAGKINQPKQDDFNVYSDYKNGGDE